jgi:biopolymer transport protein ExbD
MSAPRIKIQTRVRNSSENRSRSKGGVATVSTWDVFHSERLELERALRTDQVRAALERGDLHEDDLIRPAGSSVPWTRIGDMPALGTPESEPEPPAPVAPPPPVTPPALGATIPDQPVVFDEIDDDDVEDAEFLDSGSDRPTGPLEEGEHAVIPGPAPPAGGSGAGVDEPYGEFDLDLRKAGRDRDRDDSSVELVTEGLDLIDDDGNVVEPDDDYDPLEEDEAVAEFTLARNSAQRVEELDLAAMVDVAFQMVLFFLVTATTVLYKTLEVPKPNPESSPTAAAVQGRSRTLEDLKDDFILVEIDPAGAVKIEHEAVPAEMAALAERLRSERERTGRKAMLLSADFSTPHRSAVLAYDAANEIGLGIAIARPSPGGAAPPVAPRAGAGPPL